MRDSTEVGRGAACRHTQLRGDGRAANGEFACREREAHDFPAAVAASRPRRVVQPQQRVEHRRAALLVEPEERHLPKECARSKCACSCAFVCVCVCRGGGQHRQPHLLGREGARLGGATQTLP
eukprot:6205476-Pleurochrysis_carterae.AAC.4